MPCYLPERFFLGGNSSPLYTLGGPTSVLGFKSRGLGPADPRRQVHENSNDESADASPGLDFVGGDLAVTGFADLSFDLPLKVLRNAGIHGHVFASTGSLTSLTQDSYKNFSLKGYLDSYRSSVGLGVVVPTKLFRMEVIWFILAPAFMFVFRFLQSVCSVFHPSRIMLLSKLLLDGDGNFY